MRWPGCSCSCSSPWPAGRLFAPPSSEALTTTYTRPASCAGLDFYPTDSRTECDNAGPLRVMRYGDTANFGKGMFRCEPGLPTGAVVKLVQFTALMQEEFGMPWIPRQYGVTTCALVRSGLTLATAATAEDLGRNSSAGAAASGVIRLTTSSISNATIDNANRGYWIECEFLGVWS